MIYAGCVVVFSSFIVAVLISEGLIVEKIEWRNTITESTELIGNDLSSGDRGTVLST